MTVFPYFLSAVTTTAVTEVPSRSARSCAAFQTSSEMRTARRGVLAMSARHDREDAYETGVHKSHKKSGSVVIGLRHAGAIHRVFHCGSDRKSVKERLLLERHFRHASHSFCWQGRRPKAGGPKVVGCCDRVSGTRCAFTGAEGAGVEVPCVTKEAFASATHVCDASTTLRVARLGDCHLCHASTVSTSCRYSQGVAA